MEKIEYMGNISVDIVVEPTLCNMSVDISEESEHTSKSCNTDLNKSHDVQSTLNNISVDMSRGTEHVGKICIIDQNEYHDDKSTLDFFSFYSQIE